jgi:hypothetical protein
MVRSHSLPPRLLLPTRGSAATAATPAYWNDHTLGMLDWLAREL